MVYTSYDVLRKGFKVWYGYFLGMQKRLMGEVTECNFDAFWQDVLINKLDGIVIDMQPPKIIGFAGFEIPYSAVEKLKNLSFTGFKYFTLCTSQYDEFFLLLGFKAKAEMLNSLREQKSSHEFFISVGFKI